MTNFTTTLRRVLLAMALAGGTALASADTLPTYHVVIDSSAMAGSGYLDLDFSPANALSTGASATLSHFSGNFGSSVEMSGDVAGTVGSTITLGNSTSYNDLFRSLVLGGAFSFDVTFGGAFTNTAGDFGTTLSVGLMNGDGSAYLGNPAGALFTFDLTPMQGSDMGSVSLSNLASGVVNVTTVTTPVPEPTEYLMMLAGLGLVGALARRRQRALSVA